MGVKSSKDAGEDEKRDNVVVRHGKFASGPFAVVSADDARILIVKGAEYTTSKPK